MGKESNYFAGLGRRIMQHWQIYLLLVPMVIILIVFSYRPMGGLVIAFQRFSPFLGTQGSTFVGWDNFENLLFGRASAMFWRAVRNTFILGFYRLTIGFAFPIILAILYHELKMSKFRSFTQSVLLLPNFLSDVIVAGIVIAFLQPTTGVVNHFLLNIGLIDEGIYFLMRPEYFRGIFTFVGIWMQAGLYSLIYLAALSSISRELYESASLDGCSRLKRIWHVSLPGIRPTIVVLFIIAVGDILTNSFFERVLLLYQPVTYETADVIGSFVFRMGIAQQDFSIAAAAGLLNSVIALIMVLVANFLSRKYSESSLF